MAPLLRKKLVCFYCGRTSSQKQDGSVREWLCKQCDAVNYLDEAGEHTYPPPLGSSPDAAHYAQSVPRPTSPPVSTYSAPPFCRICLHNQHLFRECVAGYLPDDLTETDPEYKLYESRFPSYLEALEQRYPQVCANCEPQARDIIKMRHRAAKADNLRRVMDRSKNNASSLPMVYGWREQVLFTGAACYWASILIQLLWNLLGAMALELFIPCSLHVALRSPLESWQMTLHQKHLSKSCILSTSTMASAVGWGLVLAIVSLWWNPHLRKKLYLRRARALGLNDYYKLQVLVLIARFGGWVVLQDPVSYGIKPDLQWALHLVALVLFTTTTIISFFIVKLDTTPQISWKESPQSLLSKKPLEPTQQSLAAPRYEQPLYINSEYNTRSHGFPLDKIIGVQNDHRDEYRLPTPTESLDEDAMEWTPSQPQLSISRDSQLYQEGSGSLFGSIDIGKALPIEHAPELNRRKLPSALTGEPPSPTLPGAEVDAPSYAPLAPPKFAQQPDTGLEDIFSSIFSLGPDPGQMLAPPRSPFRDKIDLTLPHKDIRQNLFAVPFLVLILLFWLMGYMSGQIEKGSLGVCVVYSGLSLIDTLRVSSTQRSHANMLAFFLELVASVVLARIVFQGEHDKIWDICGKILLGILTVQESIPLFYSVSSSPASAAQQPRKALHGSNRLSHPIDPLQANVKSYASTRSTEDRVTFGKPKGSIAQPKLLSSLSISDKPPSSSPSFDPQNPPTLTSRVYPAGVNRQGLLSNRRRQA